MSDEFDFHMFTKYYTESPDPSVEKYLKKGMAVSTKRPGHGHPNEIHITYMTGDQVNKINEASIRYRETHPHFLNNFPMGASLRVLFQNSEKVAMRDATDVYGRPMPRSVAFTNEKGLTEHDIEFDIARLISRQAVMWDWCDNAQISQLPKDVKTHSYIAGMVYLLPTEKLRKLANLDENIRVPVMCCIVNNEWAFWNRMFMPALFISEDVETAQVMELRQYREKVLYERYISCDLERTVNDYNEIQIFLATMP